MIRFYAPISLSLLVALISLKSFKGEPLTAVQHIYHCTQWDVSFECPFLEGRHIDWQEKENGEIIAINGTIFSTNAKYHNFDVLTDGNESILVIHNAGMEDEGVYSCQNPTRKSSSFWLHMQNPPVLLISVNGRVVVEESIDLAENDDVMIECNATGADPPVSVSLAVDDEPLMLDKRFMDNNTHTAYSSSHLTVLKSHGKIECIDSGQKCSTYERVIQLNVTYPPSCTVVVEVYTVPKEEYFNCTCDANPEPTKYTFTSDGKILQESDTNILSVEKLPEMATNITCLGFNGKVGYSKPGVYYFSSAKGTGLSGGAIAGIVVVIVIIAVVLIVIIGLLFSKRKTSAKYSGVHRT